nr:asparagine synthase-related protein [Pseudomonas sp. A46]
MLIKMVGVGVDDSGFVSSAGWQVFQIGPDTSGGRELYLCEYQCGVEIINPVENGLEVYIRVGFCEVVVSKDILDLLDDGAELSRDVVVKYMNGVRDIGDSIWKGVHVLGLGVAARIGRDLSLSFYQLEVPRFYGDPADILERFLSGKVENRNVAIRFSGGVESTALLATCKRLMKRGRILAVTWAESGAGGSSDVIESSRIAKVFDVEHLIVPIEEEDLFRISPGSKLSGYPTPALAFSGFLEYLNEIVVDYFDGDVPIILDGHGGDHAFLEYIEAPMLIGCLGRGFWGKLKEYSELNATNCFKVIFEMVFGRRKEVNSLVGRGSLFFARRETCLSSINSMRMKRIREALDEIGVPRLRGEDNILYPFLDGEMLGRALAYSLSDLFDGKNSRLPLRESLSKKFDFGNFSRRSKGVVTGVFQKSLKLKKEELLPLILGGYCAAEEIINIEEINKVYRACSHGVFGVDHGLMNLIVLELLILNTFESLERRRYEIL